MSLKTGILAAVSALGLFAAAPAAHADSFYGRAPARPIVTVRAPGWHGRTVRWAPRYVAPRVVAPRVVVAPSGYSPVVAVPPSYGYPIAQPVYTQTSYTQTGYDDGCNHFVDQVNRELSQLEYDVRVRVSNGQLDGNALTMMESGRDDIREDLSDVSQKGFINDADRAHIEADVQALRQKLGC